MIRFVVAALTALCLASTAQADIDIQEVESPGGITAWLVESHELPFVALELRFRGGASLDAEGKRGATKLMTGLLEEGTGDLDANGFAKATESIAAKFSYRASDDSIAVSAKFLTETRDEAVDLLRRSLVAPSFPEDAIARVKAQIIAGIKQDQADPQAIAGDAFAAFVFGDHPYGSNPDGTIESVSALTREDIQAAHRAAMARDRIYVSAAGDITAEELGALLDTLLMNLPAEGAPMPAQAEVNLPGGVKVVDFPTPQSIAIFAQRGLRMEDQDFFPAYILNTILGGGSFESRLMQEVREKRGLTYGVYSYIADKDYATLWQGSVASANDRVAEAIAVISDEWARLKTQGATVEEVENAKTYLTGEYPLRFDGNGPIANIAVGMQMMGLPKAYIAERNAYVEAVTVEDVNRVAKKWLDPAELTFVVVGQPEGLEATLN